MKRQNVIELLNSNNKSAWQQFLLSLLATTVSIVLTFGTSGFIEWRQKEAAKKEMVMMIVYDFDKTIEDVQKAETAFKQASELQQLIALHPEYYDSLRFQFTPAVTVSQMAFSETTENIFSSNIETFNTLGNVNFVHEVSNFYGMRKRFQEQVLDVLKNTVNESAFSKSVENLFKFDFPDNYYMTRIYLSSMKRSRNLCMKMMKISEEEMKEFSQLRLVDEKNSLGDEVLEQGFVNEMLEAESIINEAKKKLQQNE